MPIPTAAGQPTPPRRGLVSRLPLASRVFSGAAVTRAQVAPYAQSWVEANQRDWEREGPLWVVMGDSTAQGIGATSFDRGYVGLVRRLLEAETGSRWRVLNLSRSGDRAEDVVVNQVPVLRMVEEVRLVSCVIGGNDLLHTAVSRIEARLTTIMNALPEGGVIGTLPQGLRGGKAREVNAFITRQAPGRGLRVADIWTASGPPWRGRFAADQFHPNDVGYAAWADAVAAAAGLAGRVTVDESPARITAVD